MSGLLIKQTHSDITQIQLQQRQHPTRSTLDFGLLRRRHLPQYTPPPSHPTPSDPPDPIVTQVTSTTLGPHPSLRFISGNTALPPTPISPPLSQPTHTDADFDHPPLPFALVINIPLVTMTPANGSTEIWLGTHSHTSIADQEGAHGERASGRIKKDLLSARREQRPPCQPVVPRGSVVVRDLRLWHGGMPNLGEVPRVMLALSESFTHTRIYICVKRLTSQSTSLPGSATKCPSTLAPPCRPASSARRASWSPRAICPMSRFGTRICSARLGTRMISIRKGGSRACFEGGGMVG